MVRDIAATNANMTCPLREKGPRPKGISHLSKFNPIGQDTIALSVTSGYQHPILGFISEKAKGIGQSALTIASDITGLSRLQREALEDMNRPPAALPKRDHLANQIAKGLATHPHQFVISSIQPAYAKALSVLSQEKKAALQAICASPEFVNGDLNRKAAILISLSGAGPTKLCQIAASDTTLSPQIREIFGQLKSCGIPTRTQAQTQKHIDQIYGQGKYTIQGFAGVGSIGEVAFATRADGQKVIIKNLKSGVSKESLEAEQEIIRGLVAASCQDPAKSAYQRHIIDNLYKGWIDELDFSSEAKNADALAKHATRYQVAKTLELGYEIDPITKVAKYNHPTSMVQETAPGISLDQLCNLLKQYQKSPHTYPQQFHQLLAQHPWLKDPTVWIQDIPAAYLDSFNEQILLRTQKGCKVASHGDPHSGNVFIHYNQQAKKLEVTYIDAGLVALRDTQKAASHLGLLANSMLGNSDALARTLVDNAEKLPNQPKAKIIQEIKGALDSKLFKARVNLTDSHYNNQLFDYLMEEKGIFIPESETAFFKAQMQAVMNYNELSKLTGQIHNNYLLDSLPDIAKGASRLLLQEPIEAARHLLPILPHLATDGQNALRNACQFLMRRV